MSPNTRKAIRSSSLVASLLLSACSQSPAPSALRPSDVLARSPATRLTSTTQAKYFDSWNLKPRPRATPDAMAIPVASTENEQAKAFMASSPLFQRRIQGNNLDSVTQSINAITAELPEQQAKGFQQAAKLLMVSGLPLEQAMGTRRNLSDQEISDSVVKSLSGKTPWEILVEGRQKRQELEAKVASEQNQTPMAYAR